MDKINLYCLPFAGGSRYSYRGYVNHAPPTLNVVPIEIPGRGSRSNELPLVSLKAIADDVFVQIRTNLDKPYIIYGHSMGSLIGYLLTKRIIAEGFGQPRQLFFTGCVGPSIRYRDQVDHRLPKKEFFDKIRNLGGSSDDALADEGLMAYFEPILRADFEAVATYQYEETSPFDIPIFVVIGKEEKATVEEAMAWQKETTAPVEVHELPGNHFFIHQYEKLIMNMILNQAEAKTLLS
jgi:surfactin synthase thioesterase subunit